MKCRKTSGVDNITVEEPETNYNKLRGQGASQALQRDMEKCSNSHGMEALTHNYHMHEEGEMDCSNYRGVSVVP